MMTLKPSPVMDWTDVKSTAISWRQGALHVNLIAVASPFHQFTSVPGQKSRAPYTCTSIFVKGT